MPGPATNLLSDLATVLVDLGVRWYIFGAQAVVIHGRPRMTEDVDVTVELGRHTEAAFIKSLTQSGFSLSPLADSEFIAATHVLPFTHQASGMALDVVLAGPGLETLFLDQAEHITIDSLLLPVIRVEHLLVTKILAGRRKDTEDAEEIIAARSSKLDLQVIRQLLRDLESALSRGDLISLFENMLKETEQI